MDTSLWNNFKDIKVLPTKKKFFGKYLYKIVTKVPASRLVLNHPVDKIADELAKRVEVNEARRQLYIKNWGGLFHGNYQLDNYNTKQLEYYAVVRAKYSNIKMRVEEPWLSIYSDDEQTLYDIACGDHMGFIAEIHRPKNDRDMLALNEGNVLVSPKLDYEYKIVLKDGINTNPRVAQIYDQLMALGEQIRLTPGCRGLLTNPHKMFWMPSAYFYVKDSTTASFVQLILPADIISGIYKLEKTY